MNHPEETEEYCLTVDAEAVDYNWAFLKLVDAAQRRWDLKPGSGSTNWMLVDDLTSLTAGATGKPPMNNGVAVYNSSFVCSAHPGVRRLRARSRCLRRRLFENP
jgi:hypothetical protein